MSIYQHPRIKLSKDYDLLFHQKIREHGIENFSFEILEVINTLDQDVVNEKEIFWIKEKNSYVRNGKGYNLTYGGEGYVRNRKISIEDAKDIINQIKQGVSYQTIGQQYNIGSSYVCMINYGIYFHVDTETYPIKKYYKTNEDYAELVTLLKFSTLSLKEISEKLGIGYSTIKKINAGTLRKGLCNEYPIRKKTVYEISADVIKDLLLHGASDSEIQQQIPTSTETIRRINIGETHYDANLVYPLR